MKKKIIPLLVVSALSFGGLFGCSADIPTDTGPNYGDSVLGKDAEIVSITKTGSDGLVDTYTILYGDGKTTTFTVTNGKDGEQGIEGKPGSDGHTPTITIGENVTSIEKEIFYNCTRLDKIYFNAISIGDISNDYNILTNAG